MSKYDSRALQDVPSAFSPEDRERLMLATSAQSRVLLYEEMLDRYSDFPDSHPYLLVRLADIFLLLGSSPFGVDLYRKAQSLLSKQGTVDNAFNNYVVTLSAEIDKQVSADLAISQTRVYSQKWKPAKEFNFPFNLPHLPEEAEEIRVRWQKLTTTKGSTFLADYLKKLAIETNHIESTFLLTEASTKDLVRRGIAEGTVNYLEESDIKDPAKIKSILNDMLAANELLHALVTDVGGLNKDTICSIHARFMKTSRFSGSAHYIPPGKTRTETRKTVAIMGARLVECCPFPDVDSELEYICKMAKQYIKTWRNPFATASWLHLVLAICHPFDDGNGRLVRLLASIPLIQHGYPPICISLKQRADYYAGIRQAYQGDYTPFIQCIVEGTKGAIDSIDSL